MTEHLTPTELESLLEAARAASPSPWRYLPSDGFIVGPGYRSTVAQTWSKLEEDFDNEKANGKFIATCDPATIERLVLMVRELQQRALGAPDFYETYNLKLSWASAQAVETFRKKAIRAIEEMDVSPQYSGHYRNGFLRCMRDAAEVVQSLPLVETEE